MINRKNNKSEIMLNITIIYTNDIKEQFEALRRSEKGVIIGRILEGNFVDCGFISKRNIKQIKNGVKWQA
jgi:hypothetical protein